MFNALIRCKSLPHVKMEEGRGKNRKLKGSALPMQVSTSLLKSEKRANTEGKKKKGTHLLRLQIVLELPAAAIWRCHLVSVNYVKKCAAPSKIRNKKPRFEFCSPKSFSQHCQDIFFA
ncbi:hypothetical protein CEXT_541751 [Caerostris extrusa]|uniref:Uncharacterized protein n=1 Tax=Caerostris extrusa TaxID=172846 RepID=A0AAV4WQZ6_CAEEX|nr:hypothetical protein CEXT_541751 [Caerostris extrusa]